MKGGHEGGGEREEGKGRRERWGGQMMVNGHPRAAIWEVV